ncbi:ICAM1 protein, partial [Corythaixoides concolor]|nr:ICAM1 protein [Corythaixoides concolor]
LLNVTEWNPTILGYYECRGVRKMVNTNLTVYRKAPWREVGVPAHPGTLGSSPSHRDSPVGAPESVVVDPVPQLAVGHSHELKCRVAGAAPIRNLTVSLRRGDEVLSAKTFKGQSQDEPGEVEVAHRLTAQRRDHG